MAQDYSQWVQELARRSGASVEQSDIDRLNQTNPDDVGRLQGALESQYRRRAGSAGQGDSSTFSAQGYGSARSETADDGFNPTGSGGSGGGGSRPSATQQWLGTGSGGIRDFSGGGFGGGAGGGSQFPDWYRSLMERSMGMREKLAGQNEERMNALYGTLSDRARTSLAVDRNDPVIRAEADAYAAQQRRAQRDYISDTAERSGPLANIQGERRMAAQRFGQATGAYEAGLIGRERGARRGEVSEAIAAMSSLLGGDKARELALLQSQMGAGANEGQLALQARGQDLGYDTNMRNLGLQDWDRQMYWDMLQRGLLN